MQQIFICISFQKEQSTGETVWKSQQVVYNESTVSTIIYNKCGVTSLHLDAQSLPMKHAKKNEFVLGVGHNIIKSEDGNYGEASPNELSNKWEYLWRGLTKG